MSAHKPTAEQQQIVEAAKTGQSGVVEAGAGTGKTSTLVLIAEALAPKRGLYLAYNKAIQVEASTKFPENVECRTAHSIAYREFGARNRHRLNGRRISARQYAAALHISPFSYKIGDEAAELHPSQLATIVKEAVSRFCNSADREPSSRNIPFDSYSAMGDADRQRFLAHVTPYLVAAWQDITSPKGQLTFTHDCYLKMWSLANMDNPNALRADFVLFDEAQDANPAIAVVVEAQACQTIMVGDRAQAIYGWRGAVDAMESFKGDWRLFLTQSFRFGQAVAEQANRWLVHTGTPLRLSGFDQIPSTVETIESPNCVLCRTNAGCIESAMTYQERGLKVAIVGGTGQIEAFVNGANELMQGQRTNHPELAAFRDWSDVQAAVKSGEASDLGMMVRLIDNYGTHEILQVCRQSTKPEEADIIVSTAHKAKGLEWDAVRIHSDFKAPKEGGKVSVTEAMLIYVSVTRARRTLDNSALAWLDQLEAEIEQQLDAHTDEHGHSDTDDNDPMEVDSLR